MLKASFVVLMPFKDHQDHLKTALHIPSKGNFWPNETCIKKALIGKMYCPLKGLISADLGFPVNKHAKGFLKGKGVPVDSPYWK